MTFASLKVAVLAFFLFAVLALVWTINENRISKSDVGYVTDYQVYIAKNETLEFEDILSLPALSWQTITQKPDALSFGYSTSSHWIKLPLKNQIKAKQFLVINYPLLDEIDFYQVADGRTIRYVQTGDARPFDNRSVKVSNFAFPLSDDVKNTTLYLRVKSSGTLKVPLYFEKYEDLIQDEAAETLYTGAFAGYMGLMILMSLIIVAINDDKNYLLYGVYISASLGLTLNLHGLLFRWLWPTAPEWNQISTNLFAYTLIYFQLVFVCRYIKLKNGHAKTLSDIFKMVAMIGLLVSLIPQWYMALNKVSGLFILLTNMFCLYLSVIYCINNKSKLRGELYFALAWFVMAVGVSVIVLGIFGVLPSTPLVNNANMIASVLEVFFLTTAMICRFESERQARILATLQSHKEVEQRVHVEKHMLFQATHDALSHLPKKDVLLTNWPKLSAEIPDSYCASAVLIHFEGYYGQVLSFGQQVAESMVHELHDRVRCLLGNKSQYLKLDYQWSQDRAVVLDSLDLCLILTSPKDYDISDELNWLHTSLSGPFSYENLFLDIELTIGISKLHDHEKVDRVIRRAQVASKEASQRRLKVLHYHNKLGQDPELTGIIMSKLKLALDDGRLELAFQPQINTASGDVFGVEALVRWNDDEFGWIPPDVFVPIAEQCRLITPLTAFVVREACAFYQRFNHNTGHEIAISINLSARNLSDEFLIQEVSRIIEKYQVPPRLVTFEVTETAIIGDIDKSRAALEELLDLGVKMALDDFGTGYSSLVYLKELPFTELKIDKGFLVKDDKAQHNASLVEAAVLLGKTLKMEVVAEGVESLEMAEQLASYGCQICQGFYFARPMSETKFGVWYEGYDNKRNIIGKKHEITYET
jgi:EAL domain-containing protein (putative c-di-GMP-specific phosphodiesterase class I)